MKRFTTLFTILVFATAILGARASSPQLDGGHAVATSRADGGGAILLARYVEDNNDTATRRIALRADGIDFSRARCHVTDAIRTYTEVPLEFDAAGAASLRLQPNSFALVEW